MRAYHREDMRHLHDSERYRDYETLADDAWLSESTREVAGPSRRTLEPESLTGAAPGREDRVRRRQAPRGLLRGVIDAIVRPAEALRSMLFRAATPRSFLRSDARIHDDVYAALEKDSGVDATDLEVVVRQGSVTLVGVLATPAMRSRAEGLVADVRGVKKVKSRVRVA
jgi:hypothetical protein